MLIRDGALTEAGITRRSRLILLALLAGTLLLPTARADAVTDIYMKTTSPNLVGESNSKEHQGWIELHSFKWHGVSRTDRSGKATFGLFEIEKGVDRSSPYFMQFAAAGWNLGSVLIVRSTALAEVPIDFDRYCLENVVVMSQASSAVVGDDRGTARETVTLSYTKFERWYETSDKERVTTGWDTLAFRGTPFNTRCAGVAQ